MRLSPNRDTHDCEQVVLDAMKMWFVDDKRENHETWLNSFSEEIRRSCELRSFFSVSDAIAEFARGNLPDILFLDFFIGERLGIELVRWFDNAEVRPVLIAHSSMEPANLGMVREGADFYLEKIKDRPHTDSIRSAFTNIGDLTFAIENRAVRKAP